MKKVYAVYRNLSKNQRNLYWFYRAIMTATKINNAWYKVDYKVFGVKSEDKAWDLYMQAIKDNEEGIIRLRDK